MARLGDVPDRPEDKVKGEERAAIFMFHSVLRWPEEVLSMTNLNKITPDVCFYFDSCNTRMEMQTDFAGALTLKRVC